MNDTTRHIADDAVPVDFDTLSPELQDRLEAELRQLEKRRVRAEALHDRLADRGLANEAEQLGVRQMTVGFGPHASQLEALETIVARLDLGATPDLMNALRTGAGTQAALQLLNNVLRFDGPTANGERYAVALICKSDDEGGAFHIGADVSDALLTAIEGSEESLRNRLALTQEALRRLRAAGVGQGPLN